MPATPNSPVRAVVLADSDTRWKWGALTARALTPGAEVGARLLRGRATPTARQLADTGVAADDARETTLTGFLDEVAVPPAPHTPAVHTPAAPAGGDRAAPYDVLVLACVGHTVQAVLQGLARRWPDTTRRPVLVTGYCGVVYEKLTEGLLLRHGADLLLAGSPWDARRFRETLTGVGADARSVATWPLPFLGGTPHDPEPAARGDRPFRVVFAVQPSVPDGPAARRYLLDRAIGHARRHPGREVVLKLRSAPGEHTTHVEETPYQRLAARVRGGLPANVRLAYGHMGELLDTTDLLVTVSSTAALESLSRGVPTAVLTDLGVREPLGNHWFTGSDCLTSWDELDAGHLPEADPHWLADRGVTAPSAAAPGAGARQALAELLAEADGPGLA
ncbi:DUF6716 putative glycosyltransferase, partial [Streptomyces lonarensis]